MEVTNEIEVLEGSENPIQLVQSLTKEFKCNYELVFFPFDTQVKLFHLTGIKKNLTYWFQQELFTLRCAVTYRYETLFFFALNFYVIHIIEGH